MTRQRTPTLPAAPDAVAKAHAVYTPFMLAFYDVLVYGVSNRIAWRCPTQRLLDLYRSNLSANHLEAGAGTGLFLDQTGDGRLDRLALLDISRNCLDRSQRRLARFAPELYQVNLLAPIELELPPFASIGLTYVLHCLPGRMHEKLAAVDYLRPLMQKGTVLSGLPFSIAVSRRTSRHERCSISITLRACSIIARTISLP